MFFPKWDPFQSVKNFHNTLSGLTRTYTSPGFPPVDIIEKDSVLIIMALIPGIEPEDIDISAVPDRVEITGEKERASVEHSECILRERGYGSFRKTVTLPVAVEVDEISAEYRCGILFITLPRKKPAGPRSIEIT